MIDFSTIALPENIATLAHASLTVGTITITPFAIFKGIIIILSLLWFSGIAIRRIDRRLRRVKGMRASNRTLILKLIQIALYCLVFIVGMQLLGINLTALSVFSGALGVGLGFGLQKIASNFISGIILLFEKSVEVNDVIELADGTIGTVRRTRARYTLIETPDGRDVLIPNEEFISQRVISWTHSDKHARVEIIVTVSYGSDLELARTLMLAAADAHAKRVKTRPSICVLHAFGDSGVEIHLYFWITDITTDGRMEPKSDVMLAIIKEFKAHAIAIPYPQRELRVTNIASTTDMAAAGGA